MEQLTHNHDFYVGMIHQLRQVISNSYLNSYSSMCNLSWDCSFLTSDINTIKVGWAHSFFCIGTIEFFHLKNLKYSVFINHQELATNQVISLTSDYLADIK